MGGEGRILIIDDDSKTRNAYKDLFLGYGFDTRVAESEDQALALLGSESYEAVLVDLMVSNNALVSIAERIKRNFPKVFVSMMIADCNSALIKRAIDAGIDDYLVKPLVPMQLIEGVKKGILRYELEEENHQLKQKLAELQAQNQQWIIHDLETGVPNSQYFSDRLDREVKRAKRHEHWLSLLLCDLGQSTSGIANDEPATPSQGAVLELLKILSGNTRDIDIITRYNTGFAIILPETTMKGSSTLCSRLKKGLVSSGENADPVSDFRAQPKLKVRFGTATYPLDSHLPKKLIKIAEERLQ